MGDLVQKTVIHSAVRAVASPIESVAAFQTIVDGVIANNPFGYTAYQVGTENYDPVEKSRKAYTARIVFHDLKAKTVGTVAARSPTVAAYGTNVTTVMGDAVLATAMGGTAVHALEDDSFAAALPRPERRGLHGRVHPGPGHDLVLRGRCDPHHGRDLGRQRAGTRVSGYGSR